MNKNLQSVLRNSLMAVPACEILYMQLILHRSFFRYFLSLSFFPSSFLSFSFHVFLNLFLSLFLPDHLNIYSTVVLSSFSSVFSSMISSYPLSRSDVCINNFYFL